MKRSRTTRATVRTGAGIAAAVLALSAIPGAAQPYGGRDTRVGLGVGAGTAGLVFAVDVSVNAERRLYRGRLTAHDNLAGATVTTEGRRTVTELAFMLGRGHRFVRNYGSVSAGLALVDDDIDTNRGQTIGIPLEAQLVSGGPIGLGIALAANLNPRRSFGAFILSVQIGRTP